jgi:hypothetical protein
MGPRVPRLSMFVVWAVVIVLCGCGPRPGHVRDEAKLAGREPASFTAADEDYFHDMDGGVALSSEEVKGRNMWLVWTGGNDRFWDVIPASTYGALDLLKTLSSRPGLPASRDNRWNYLGVVNEPCFEKATGPDPDRFGLWLDKRRVGPDCPPDPFENESKYPGVKIGARGKTMPVGSYYGYATGVVGLRLFPNPNFDEAARKKWDPVKFYDDPAYYQDPNLVRPYRVGMSCAFCHVGPMPTKPPTDPENPKWENLSSTVGAQYFWIDRIFVFNADKRNFMYQVLHTSRPGALDTSLVSTDNINNPRTMNAIYNLPQRMELARRWGREILAGGGLNNRQFNDYIQSGPLTEFFQKPDISWTPHVLKDGSDSVGALGALNRVYLNIGLFSEEWLLHFNPLVGGKAISPIEIAVANRNSSYWGATEMQTPNMASFLLKAGRPDRLKDAPGGAAYLTTDANVLTRGKIVFAERCARCHSSIIPKPAPGLDPTGCAGPGYLECWQKYWEWTKTEDFKSRMRPIVLADNFLDNNYLSTDVRVPVTLLQTNACSPLATNALGGNIWDNFSSQSYKDLPTVGQITFFDPFSGEPRLYQMPAGGRGYTRPPSLVSLWSTAPLLLNNALGKFDPSPSVEARMGSFQDSIEKLLWPEKREKDPVLGDKVPGEIDRTTADSYLTIPSGYLPGFVYTLRTPLHYFLPWAVKKDGSVELGPIPKGTPIDLLANLDSGADIRNPFTRIGHLFKLIRLSLRIARDLKSIPPDASVQDRNRILANLAQPLMELSKCPDFVVNRGHYFGTDRFKEEPGLSDDDKRALIEFLKTF